jgi:predicted phage terminase large subunit-like protein
LSQVPDEEVERIRRACRESLKFLCKEILGMRDWSRVHDDLAVFMRRPSKRKLILVPRNHLKSSIITKGWSIQQMLKNPDIRILIANATWDNSRKFLGSIQKYLTWGSVLPQYFGHFESQNWNQFDCTVKQRKAVLDSPTWVTTGVDKEQTSQHYDIIIADDLVGPQNVQTKEQRQKVFDYYLSLFDLLEPEGVIVAPGTRYHQDDLYSRILEEAEEQKNWDVFLRTAFNPDGSILFPEKFTLEKLNEIRNKPGGKLHWFSQYENNPINPEAADFKIEQIRFYEPGSPNPGSLYLTVDPAISLSRDADFSAFVVAGQFSDRRIRVVDCLRRRVIPSDLVDQIFALVAKWKLHRIGLETFSFQKTLKYEIQRQQRARNIFFAVDELGRRNAGKEEPPLSKEARIRRLQPYFEQGLIEIRRDMQELVDELVAFPRGKHDDMIDALSYQLDYLVPSLQTVKPQGITHGSMAWWLGKVPEKQATIYERFMSDLRNR